MTVETTASRAQYDTNGTTGPWTVPFPFLRNEDLQVVYTDADGDDATLVLDADFSVVGAGGESGTITTVQAYPAGGKLTVLRNIEPLQQSDYVDGDPLPAETLERDLDRLTMRDQQTIEVLDRALVVPPSEAGYQLPPAAQRKGKLLGFDIVTGAFALIAAATGSILDFALQLASAAGSSLVGFIQAGVDAVLRTLQDKGREVVSVKDFGAVGDGVTNCMAAFLAAEVVASDIYLPAGTYLVPGSTVLTKRYWGPGTISYTGRSATTFTGAGLNDLVTSGDFIGLYPLTVWVEPTTTDNPNKYRFSLDGGATWISTTTTILPGDIEVTTDLVMTTAPQALGHSGVSIAWGAAIGHTVGNRWTFTLRPNPKRFDAGNALILRNQVAGWIDGDRSVAFGQNCLNLGRSISFENVAFGVDVLKANQTGYGNVAMGVRAGEANTHGFLNTYLGTWAGRDCTTGDGNTAVGAYSQIVTTTGGFNTSVGNDALSFPNAGTENVAVGVQALHGNDENQLGGWNPQRNTAVGVQAMSEVENAQFNVAIGFGVAKLAKSVQGICGVGYAAFTALTTGTHNTGVGTQAGSKVTTGSSNIFLGSGSGNAVGQKVDATNSIAIGNDTFTTANNQIVIGNSSHTAAYLYGNFLPQTDNGQSVGMGAARWSVIYAATGTINTSDERHKTAIRPLSEAERRVALWLKGRIGAFKFLDAIEEKGDGARWHFGVGAQTVATAFADEGLDAADYGLFCYDEWPEEVVEWDAQPDADPPVEAGRKVIRAAGNRFGVRYDELAMFILAAI